jgi:hypothetical protein
MTDAQRKAAERKRKKEAGLIRTDVWVPADRVEDIREIAAKMREKEQCVSDKIKSPPPPS